MPRRPDLAYALRRPIGVIVFCASFALAAHDAGAEELPQGLEDALVAIEDAAVDQRMPLQERLLVESAPYAESLAALAADADASALRRALAAWTLTERGDAAACAALEAGASAPANEAPHDRVAFAIGLLRCGDPDPLRALLNAETPVVAAKAAITLAMERDAAARDAIDALRAEPAMADLLLFLDLALALLGDESQQDTLRALLRQPSARAYAAIALVRQGDRGAVIDVRIAAAAEDPWIRFHALEALVAAHSQGTPDLLRRASDDPNPRVARFAERELRLWSRRAPAE